MAPDIRITVCGGVDLDLSTIGREVTIDLIAHALARINRFGGHLECETYSVAQHSVLVHDLVARTALAERWAAGVKLEALRHALMHDAAEAFVGDMILPIKRLLPAFRDIHDMVEGRVFQRFNVRRAQPGAVRVADRLATALEASRFFRRPPAWATAELAALVPPLLAGDLPNPRPWRPSAAAKVFLDRAEALGLHR